MSVEDDKNKPNTNSDGEEKGAVDYFLDGDEEGLKKFVHDTVVQKVSDYIRKPKDE